MPHGYLSDDEGAAEHDDRLAKSDCLADAAAPRKVCTSLVAVQIMCMYEFCTRLGCSASSPCCQKSWAACGRRATNQHQTSSL